MTRVVVRLETHHTILGFFQERSHQLEQECARLTEALRVHEVGAKSFAVECADHAVLQEKLESRYKSLNKKYQGKHFDYFGCVQLYLAVA